MHNSRVTKTLVFLETQDLKTQDFHTEAPGFSALHRALWFMAQWKRIKNLDGSNTNLGENRLKPKKWILDRSLLNFVLKIDILWYLIFWWNMSSPHGVFYWSSGGEEALQLLVGSLKAGQENNSPRKWGTAHGWNIRRAVCWFGICGISRLPNTWVVWREYPCINQLQINWGTAEHEGLCFCPCDEDGNYMFFCLEDLHIGQAGDPNEDTQLVTANDWDHVW